MKSGPDIKAQRLQRIDEGIGAADGSAGAVECCEDPVTSGFHNPSLVLQDEGSGEGVMGLEEVPPRVIAERRGPFCRSDDVSEQDGCERTLGNDDRGEGSQELINMAKRLLPTWLAERPSVSSRKQGEVRSCNVFGDVTPVLDWRRLEPLTV